MIFSTLKQLLGAEKFNILGRKDFDQIEISKDITQVLLNLSKNVKITPEEIENFVQALNSISGDQLGLRKELIGITRRIASTILEFHKEEIKKSVESIDQSISNKQLIRQETSKNNFISLMNAYQLLSKKINNVALAHINADGYIYNVSLISEIIFAINALTLTNILDKKDFESLNSGSPLYPLEFQMVKEKKLPIQKGIKESGLFFPYKAIKKIFKGGGDHTFIATNGKKALYMRGVEEYAPLGIMASKISTLIHEQHFASERLMDNKIVGSKGIPGYVVSIGAFLVPNERAQWEEWIKEKKKIFPGTGIIDEVCNFICEGDPNLENLGLSSNNLDNFKTYLTKIDFDCCGLNLTLEKENYDRNIYSKRIYGVLLEKDKNFLENNENYIQEKLYTRLKLSMLTKPILECIANKSFLEEDKELREKTIVACIEKSNVALNLFLEHKFVKEFIRDNPEILEKCLSEITTYIKRHFESCNEKNLIQSLNKRIFEINHILNKKLTLDYTLKFNEDLKASLNFKETPKKVGSIHIIKEQAEVLTKKKFITIFQESVKNDSVAKKVQDLVFAEKPNAIDLFTFYKSPIIKQAPSELHADFQKLGEDHHRKENELS